MSTHILIIGGVAGGMSAATRMRRLNEQARITVLEKGEHVSFANCGLPYYAGGVIDSRDKLLLQTPEALKQRFNIDVLVQHEATRIDPEAKTVTVRTPVGEQQMAYDELILAPGAKPFIPPIPGVERALSLRNVADVDAIVDALAGDVTTAVVMGGGFIGIEMAENLHRRGLKVTLVEAAPQILAPLDEEMAAIVDNHMVAGGIDVRTGAQAVAVGEKTVTLSDGDEVPADLVIAAVGVRPDSALAAEAGITVDGRGGIVVDEQQRTNIEHIYAVGDAVVKRDRITGQGVHVPLANSANRDGRMVADVIAGLNSATGATRRAAGVLGTAIVGAMGLTAACTGMNERRAKAEGKNYATIHTHPFNHATYYPGAAQMSLKLVYDPDTREILGAQAVGTDGVDKRIDVLATAIAGGLSVDDLAGIDLAYAPQYGLAKDPVTMLGFVADNDGTGTSPLVDIFALEQMQADGHLVLDVRTPGEYEAGNIPGSVNIELDALREEDNLARIQQLSQGKPVVVHCAVGVRGHTATRLLAGHGIEAVNLSGGYKTYAAWAAKKARSAS